MKPIVAVVGSSNTDLVVKLPRLPRPGETLIGNEFMALPGGKGANQAVAAARMGAHVVFIAKLGADSFGDAAIENFRKDGISVDQIRRDREMPSGVALIFVGADGQNMIAVASGANARLSVADIEESADIIARSGVLLTQLETPIETVARAVEIAYEHNVPTILNPAPAMPISSDLISRLTFITPNESEAGLLSGIDVNDVSSARRAAQELIRMGARNVLITMGAEGVLFVSGEIWRHFPAIPVQAVDTTAAGDVFNGAFARMIASGADIDNAVQLAIKAASISVTRIGAQPSIPTLEEIKSWGT